VAEVVIPGNLAQQERLHVFDVTGKAQQERPRVFDVTGRAQQERPHVFDVTGRGTIALNPSPVLLQNSQEI